MSHVNPCFRHLASALHDALNNCPRTAAILPTLTALYAPLTTPSFDHPRVDRVRWARVFAAIELFANNVRAALTHPTTRDHLLHKCHQDGRTLLVALDNIGFFASFLPSLPRSFLLYRLVPFMPPAPLDTSLTQEFASKMRFAHQLLRSPFTIYTAVTALCVQPASDTLDFAGCVTGAVRVPVPPGHSWTHPVDGSATFTDVLKSAGLFFKRLDDAKVSKDTMKNVMVFLTTLLGLCDFPMDSLFNSVGHRLELPTFSSSHIPPVPIQVCASREFRHMHHNTLVWTSLVTLVVIPVKPVHTKLFPVFAHCSMLLRSIEHENLLTMHGTNWPLPKPERTDPTTWCKPPLQLASEGSARNAFVVVERTSCDLFEAISKESLQPVHLRLQILIDILKGLQALHMAGLHHPALTPSNVRLNVASSTGYTGFAKLDQTCILYNALFSHYNNLVTLSTSLFFPPETIHVKTTRPHLHSNMWNFALIGCFLLAGRGDISLTAPLKPDSHRTVAVSWLERIPLTPVRNALRPCFNMDPNDRPMTAQLLQPLQNVLAGISTQLTTSLQPRAASVSTNGCAPAIPAADIARTAAAAAAAAAAATAAAAAPTTAAPSVTVPPQSPQAVYALPPPMPSVPQSRQAAALNSSAAQPRGLSMSTPNQSRLQHLRLHQRAMPSPSSGLPVPQTSVPIPRPPVPASAPQTSSIRRSLPIARPVPEEQTVPVTSARGAGPLVVPPIPTPPTPTPATPTPPAPAPPAPTPQTPQTNQPFVLNATPPVRPRTNGEVAPVVIVPTNATGGAKLPPNTSTPAMPTVQCGQNEDGDDPSPPVPVDITPKPPPATAEIKKVELAAEGEKCNEKQELVIRAESDSIIFNENDLADHPAQNRATGDANERAADANGQAADVNGGTEADSSGTAAKLQRSGPFPEKPPPLPSDPNPQPNKEVSHKMLVDLLNDIKQASPAKARGNAIASDNSMAHLDDPSFLVEAGDETPSLHVSQPQISVALEKSTSVPAHSVTSPPCGKSPVRKRGRSKSPTISSESDVVVKQPSKRRRPTRAVSNSAKDTTASDSSSVLYVDELQKSTRDRRRSQRINIEDLSDVDQEDDDVAGQLRRTYLDGRKEKESQRGKERHVSAQKGSQVRRSSSRKLNYKEDSSVDELNASSDSSGSLERPFHALPQPASQLQPKQPRPSEKKPGASRDEETDDSCLSNEITAVAKQPSRVTSGSGPPKVDNPGTRRASARLTSSRSKSTDKIDEPMTTITTSQPVQKGSKRPLPEDDVVKPNDGYTYSPEDEAHHALYAYIKELKTKQRCGDDALFRNSDQASRHGDVDASVTVGVCYITGTGVVKSETKGATILKSASCYGRMNAIYTYALCLQDGIGVQADEKEAFILFNQAIKKWDHVDSMYRIALMTRSGRGTQRSAARGAQLFEEGAKRGHLPSKVKLANCYAKHGQGVHRNLRTAVKLYREAEKEGSPEAILKLGLLYEDGEGLTKNPKEALKRYKLAASLGYAPAETALGQCHRWGYGVEQDDEKARDYFRSAAAKKHDLALFELGQMYRLGILFDRDYKKAADLYRRAMATELTVAVVAYGEMLYLGTGVEKNYSEAFKCFQKAADLNGEEGFRWLGDCYLDGTGVEKNVDKGFKYCLKAADLGSPVAQTSIGQCYEKGVGVKPSLTKALYHYQKGAKLNDPSSLMNLGLFHEEGKHVKQSSETAVAYYNRAIDQGSTEALCHLGDCYANGRGVEQSDEKAAELYQKGADHGMSDSQCELGRFYYLGRAVKQDYAKAVELYRKSSDAGESEASRLLGTAYFDGCGVKQDFEQAVAMYEKAAKEGNGEAMVDLGRCYRTGKGVAQDLSKAAEWFEKGASHPHSNKMAMMEIGNMYHEGTGVKQNFDKAFEWLAAGAVVDEPSTSS